MIAHSVVDPACDGSAGTVVPAPQSWLVGSASIATTMLPSGITLVIVSSGYPPASFAVVHAFTSSCAPAPAFGDNGIERLTLGGQDFSVASAVPALGGGAILVGRSGRGWLVARIEANGRLDPAFGKGGWTVLPWPGGASAVAQAPAGDIVVGGSVDGRCCQEEWVGEVNERGALVGRFGPGGRVRIPVYLEYSSVTRVAVEPGGDILALSVGGQIGIWGVTVTALTADGLPVPWFLPSSSCKTFCRRLPTGLAGLLTVCKALPGHQARSSRATPPPAPPLPSTAFSPEVALDLCPRTKVCSSAAGVHCRSPTSSRSTSGKRPAPTPSSSAPPRPITRTVCPRGTSWTGRPSVSRT